MCVSVWVQEHRVYMWRLEDKFQELCLSFHLGFEQDFSGFRLAV